MRKIVFILMIFSIVIFTSCGSNKGTTETDQLTKYKMSYSNENISKEDDNVGNKITKRADINIETEDLVEANNKIQTIITKYNANVIDNSMDDYFVTFTINVLNENLDDFLKELEKELPFKSKNIISQDVTMEYIDNDARLNILKQEEAKLLEVMNNSETVEEILKAKEEIYKVREDIELLDLNKKNYDLRIQYSTINIFIGKNESFAAKYKSLINIAVIIIIIAFVYLFYKHLRKKNKKE